MNQSRIRFLQTCQRLAWRRPAMTMMQTRSMTKTRLHNKERLCKFHVNFLLLLASPPEKGKCLFEFLCQ